MLMAIRDSSVRNARRMHREKILILSYEHAIVASSKVQVVAVGTTEESCIGRDGHVNTTKFRPWATAGSTCSSR